MTGPEASVVLAARNAAETIGEQLAALAAQDFEGPWELVVVDNGSTDATGAVIDAWQDRIHGLQIVVEPTGGYARSCNTGARAARSPRLLFCESDDVVDSGWVREMVAALSRADLVGGALEFDRLNSPRVRRSRNPVQSRRLPRLLHYLPYAMGANLGVARSAFEAAGGFDEAFTGGGGTDVDLCWRVQQLGHEIRFAPAAIVHYRFRDTLADLMKQRYRYAREVQRLYAKFWSRGDISTSPAAHYRHVCIRTLRTLRETPGLADPNRRARILGALAAAAGRFAGLARMGVLHFSKPATPSGHRRDSSPRAQSMP